MFGYGKNGKSAFNKLLSFVVFHQISTIEFANINEQNASLFASKYINVPSEITDKTFNSAILKAITSGDPISVNEKYKDPRKIIPISKQIASANKLPTLSDSSYGMWRRLQILPFDFKITSSNKIDENTLYKEFRDNSEILRIWAFQGLIRFIKNNGKHTEVKQIIQATNSYKQDENNVYQFILEFKNLIIDNYNKMNDRDYGALVFIDDIQVNKKLFKYDKGERYDTKIVETELYIIYKSWARSLGYKPLSIKNFRQKLREEYNTNYDIDTYGNKTAVRFNVSSEIIKKQQETEKLIKENEERKENKKINIEIKNEDIPF